MTSSPTPHELASKSDDPIRVQHKDGVFHVVLNRPEVRNAMGPEMINLLDQAMEQASDDERVRVILITAEGEAFSAGGNLGNFAERLNVTTDAEGRDLLAIGNRRYGRFLERLSASPKITIVAAQGAAMGGGAGLVCAADLSLGVQSAKFGFPEVSIGLVPAQILPFVAARIGIQPARRLMLTGERIDGTQARSMGMLDYLATDAQDLAVQTAEVVKQCLSAAPMAASRSKQMLRELFGMREWHSGPLSDYLDSASEAFAAQMRSEAIEGVAAARARRRPVWGNPVST